MVSRRKFFSILVLLLSIMLMLSACEMPIPGSGEPTATPDPNIGGGTDGPPQTEPGGEQTQPVEGGEQTGGEQTQPSEGGEPTQPVEGGEQTQPAEGGEPTQPVEGGEQTQPTEGGEQTQPVEGGGQTTAPPPATGGEPTSGGGTAGTPPAQEVVHIVQPGENLFRIGLQYGYSWTVLARYNGIPNPNFIVVGQAIRIPAAGSTGGSGGQPTDGNYTYYVVQPGDNLFRIGLKFGMSWVYIAEANGIVNPHYIVTGQVLKIPVSS